MIFTGKNQTLKLNTGTDLAGTTVRIRYIKPDGTTGTFSGSVSGEQVTHKFTTNDIDQTGPWFFQAEVTSGTDLLVGEIARARVIEPIDV